MSDKTGVMIKVEDEKVERFKSLYPWRGSIQQFFVQALDEFLDLSKGQKTSAELTTEAVQNVTRKEW